MLTVRGSYSSLYSVCSHLHPVLSLLLSARGTILKSTLFFLYSFLPEALFSNLPFFLYSFLSCLFVDIGWLVCGVAWCHPVCVGLYCCRRSVDCTWVLQFSLFCLFSSPPCSFSTPFCQRHYSQIYPVLSLLLSARGTILKSTLFFLYSFLSCLFVDIGWSVCGVAWCHPVCVGLYCCHCGVDCMWVLQFSIPSILISTLFFLYSFLPEALFSNLPWSFSTPFCPVCSLCQRHYSQLYPVLYSFVVAFV